MTFYLINIRMWRRVDFFSA